MILREVKKTDYLINIDFLICEEVSQTSWYFFKKQKFMFR